MISMCQPIQNPIYDKNGVKIDFIETEHDFRLEFKFDSDDAKGTIILEQDEYGLAVYCPEVSEGRVALLDLFYKSPNGQKYPERPTPPFQIVFDSPNQTDDPLGRVRFFPEDTRVDFMQGVQEIKPGPALHLKEFGYPPGMTEIDIK